MTYTLLDSGRGQKLEQFGPYILIRPCSQAVWQPSTPALWSSAHALFTKEAGWKWTTAAPAEWSIEVENIHFRIQPTEFGHLGIFPEQKFFWQLLPTLPKPRRVLNLFAYSGGTSLACAKLGMEVCHLDASPGMVQWARQNAQANHIDSIRWIVEDVIKFLSREIKRQSTYDAIIIDPPSFGRGSKKEVFKIEDDIFQLLSLCKACLSHHPAFFFFSCHTPGFTPLTLHHLVTQMMGIQGSIQVGEMSLDHPTTPIPSGSFALWTPCT